MRRRRGLASRALSVKDAEMYDNSITRWLSIVKAANAEGLIANHIARDAALL